MTPAGHATDGQSAGRWSRQLDVEGCFNVRDAGGWSAGEAGRMRTGLLYRADDPIRLTPAGRAMIDGLRLEAVVDLRQASQVARSPGFGDDSITYHVPVVDQVLEAGEARRFDRPSEIEELYRDMVQRGGPQLVEAVGAVSAHIADGPVLVHCAVGKDRTGLVVALVQAAIGVPLEAIVEEYALSDGPARRRRQAMISRPLPDDPAVALTPVGLWTAPAEAMARFAAGVIDVHGSLAAWPLALGVSADAIGRLRAALLEPSTDAVVST